MVFFPCFRLFLMCYNASLVLIGQQGISNLQNGNGRRITMIESRRVFLSCVLLVLALLSGAVFVSPALSQEFQKVPIILRASDVLPRELLSGPNYTVREAVKSDGLINVYEVDTSYGPIKVESTALVLKRINELRALVKIEALQGTNVYLNAFKTATLQPVKTAEGLITHPVDTVSGIATGVGRFFSNVGSSVTSSTPHKDSVVNSLSGQATYKREFAYQFGVDPYTSYEPLQKALNDLAWTAAAGGLTVKAALAAVPGTAVAVVSYTGTAGSLKALVNEKTPAELATINQKKLQEMGVPSPVVQAFMQNAAFSPHEQTLLVGELAAMTGVADRQYFIETAAGASDESVVVFLRVRAQLLNLYHEKVTPVARFISAGGVPLILTKTGAMVGVFPLDYVGWTVNFAQKETAVTDAVQGMQGITGKELWITGTVDPVARRIFEAKGWKVEDKIQDRLLKKLEP
jgi:hypothetical protein